MTTMPAAMSRLPSRPLNESMNATIRPPAPALCTPSPGGAFARAAASTAFSALTRSGPLTDVPLSRPTSGTDTAATDPDFEYSGWPTSSDEMPLIVRNLATSVVIFCLSWAVSPLERS